MTRTRIASEVGVARPGLRGGETPSLLDVMAHFLLIYDRAAGTLIRQQSFDDAATAIAGRFAAETEFAYQ